MYNNYDLHIVAIVEKGYLEQQFKLLVLSIEQFLKPSHNVKVIACSPRKDKQPNQLFVNFLNQHSVDYIDKPLNIEFDYFPLCNGIYAADYVSEHYKNIRSLLLVDTDTLFFNPISKETLKQQGVFMRPVDNKGIGSTGPLDQNNLFWDQVFDFFNLAPSHLNVVTTVSQQHIRPYYNSGFVLANKSINFMQQWKRDFIRLMNSSIRTAPSSSRHQVDYGFIEQMVLSVSAEKERVINILPETYNYPLPFRPKLKNREDHPLFNALTHVHYHKWFQHPRFLDYITDFEEKKSLQYLWLKEHLPLLPLIDSSFKC